ncbi:hypothetical protein NA57DRAFT_70554 [Rhizodiscina lignyota]|uniref:Anaphase-promoting complex subunit 4 n=1 Tax=Rhizodiscina lignyota TaxID=1504668 RepID=A0A9P4IRA0_9PEZI|nr:hypothetical protein NA57DRAFT_70554 [Rhizodiscina lignyota]
MSTNTMETSDALPSLALHAEKTLLTPIKPRLFACCPTMDLVAIVCQDAQLDVYRFNGQRAFGFQNASTSSKITSICWKYNGQSIAVGWENGSLDVVSAETGKVTQHFHGTYPESAKPSSGATSIVSCLGWGLNFIDLSVVKSRIATSKDGPNARSNARWETKDRTRPTLESEPFSDIFPGRPGKEKPDLSLDDFLKRLPDSNLLDVDPNLPEQLALLDVESQLPRLPILPLLPSSTGMKGTENLIAEAFASQISLDAMLHPHPTKEANTVDILLDIRANGVTLPILYGSLPLRPLHPPGNVSNMEPLLHTSSPFSCSHLVFAKMAHQSGQKQDGQGDLALLPLKLPFVRLSGIYLHMISVKTARLQNLMHYISAALDSLHYHWRHSQDLPTKFMRNVSETLAEQEEMPLAESLYHLASTGHCLPAIKEWLVDQLTERGHKRWDHAVSLGYSKMVEVTHENLLPAIDRCIILISNLRGLAAYHQDTGLFDVPPQRFTAALNAFHCLRILSHHFLICATRERRQFGAFSKWLRHEIDRQTSESTAAPTDETTEQELGFDYGQILSYIRGPLSSSQAKPFVDAAPEAAESEFDDGVSPEDISKQLALFSLGRPFAAKSLSLRANFGFLGRMCKALFDGIVKWQLSRSAFDIALLFEEHASDILDSRIVFENLPGLPAHVTTYVATVPSLSPNEVHLYRIVHSEVFDGDAKCIERIEAAIMRMGVSDVRDIKFVDDQMLIALVATQRESLLVSLPYGRVSGESDPAMHFESVVYSSIPSRNTDATMVKIKKPQASEEASVAWDTTNSGPPRKHVIHAFSADSRFRPVHLNVNGRRDRRVVCVLGDDLKHYKVFDLDTAEGDSGETTIGGVDEDMDTVMND